MPVYTDASVLAANAPTINVRVYRVLLQVSEIIFCNYSFKKELVILFRRTPRVILHFDMTLALAPGINNALRDHPLNDHDSNALNLKPNLLALMHYACQLRSVTAIQGAHSDGVLPAGKALELDSFGYTNPCPGCFDIKGSFFNQCML